MARGWESKGVEAQQEAAASRAAAGPPVSRSEADRRTRHATLMLARTRALADLQQACMPVHRAMLEEAIAELDRQLAQVAEAPR